MKKKAILAIPYATAKKVSLKYDYIAVVFLKKIVDEKHLFVEIYKNKKEKLQVPVCRYVYTKKDWCKFNPEQETWHRTKIHNAIEGSSSSWEKHNETTFISSEDSEKVKKFRNTHKDEILWWSHLESLEDSIKHERWRRDNNRRQERLEERCSLVPDMPKEFKQWCEGELFKDINLLYYKRKGRYATFTCSHCGKTYKKATERGQSLEDQAERVVEIPQNGKQSICEECGAIGTYKTEGHAKKSVYGMRKQCYVGQRTEKGIVIRYIEAEKFFYIGEKESFNYTEIARAFFEEGKKVVIDYHLYDNWNGEKGWHDHNIGGIGPQISLNAAEVFPGTIEQLKGTFLQYTGIEEYIRTSKKIKIVKYMKLYTDMPCIEMFSKMGLWKLVDGLIEGRGIMIYKHEKKLGKIFGINNDKVKMLVKECGLPEFLKVLQIEKELNQNWSYEQCKTLINIWPNWSQVAIALQHMTIKKLFNRIEKYAGCNINAFCGVALERIKNTSITYLDYLSMRQILGYDLDNSIIQYPKDLEDGHRKMVLEINKKEMEIRIVQVESKYSAIRKCYKALTKMYAFEEGEYTIRPAKSAEEIVIEGRTLHHCVGGDNYLKKHNNGETAILFLRKKENLEQQYITVEIQDYKILQWYGAYNKKPDKEKIENWLNNWIKTMKARILTTKDSEQIAV